jgi:hypothetical protein
MTASDQPPKAAGEPPATDGTQGEDRSPARLPRDPWRDRAHEHLDPDEIGIVDVTIGVRQIVLAAETSLRTRAEIEDMLRGARVIGEAMLVSTTLSSGLRTVQDEVDREVEALLREHAASLEQRYLSARAPGAVEPGRRFAIEAALQREAAEGFAALKEFLVGAEGREVSIDLHVQAGARVISDVTQSVVVRAGQDTEPVRFELVAADRGVVRASLRVFSRGAFLGELPLTVAIGGIANVPSMQPPPRASLRPTDAAPRSATLLVDVDPARRALTMRLTGPGAIGTNPEHTIELARTLDAISAEITQQLDSIAKNALELKNPVGLEALIRGIGADLWSMLLPEPIRALLAAHTESIDRLEIIGDGDSIPWELIRMPSVGAGGAGTSAEYLSDRCLVTRWFYGSDAPSDRIGHGPPLYVQPASAPKAAGPEIDALIARLGPGARIGRMLELLAALQAPEFGVLHVAAHNMLSGTPGSAYLQLDQPFFQRMLSAESRDRMQAQAPLVFLNACNSAQAVAMWTEASSWARRFVDAGAGAFVGSMWQVRDGTARDFAIAFYEQLVAGKPLGESFGAARAATRIDADPTRLAYTLYGSASATLAKRPTPTAPSPTL